MRGEGGRRGTGWGAHCAQPPLRGGGHVAEELSIVPTEVMEWIRPLPPSPCPPTTSLALVTASVRSVPDHVRLTLPAGMRFCNIPAVLAHLLNIYHHLVNC